MTIRFRASIAWLQTLPGASRPHLATLLPAPEATLEKEPVECYRWPKPAVLGGGLRSIPKVAGNFSEVILGRTKAGYIAADAAALITLPVEQHYLLHHAN